MRPHPDNACSGKYDDWLEVNLLSECNASCAWCIEHDGWHPQDKATWYDLCEQIVSSRKKNIILLGGEPTIYPKLSSIVHHLYTAGLNVYTTTNGSMLTPDFASYVLRGTRGINISIHHYNMDTNSDIVGVKLNPDVLRSAIETLHEFGGYVRFNCNCIEGCVDSVDTVYQYIQFAKTMGANSVRFAELKGDGNGFVDIVKMFGGNYGLTQDPYNSGCSINATLLGMPVNFRIMCGLQTHMRPSPPHPEQTLHPVLYYDGNFYNGWQRKEEHTMAKSLQQTVERLIAALRVGQITEESAVNDIMRIINSVETTAETEKKSPLVGCRY